MKTTTINMNEIKKWLASQPKTTIEIKSYKNGSTTTEKIDIALDLRTWIEINYKMWKIYGITKRGNAYEITDGRTGELLQVIKRI